MLWMLRQVYYIHENTKQSSFLAYLLVPTGSQIILVGILFFFPMEQTWLLFKLYLLCNAFKTSLSQIHFFCR